MPQQQYIILIKEGLSSYSSGLWEPVKITLIATRRAWQKSKSSGNLRWLPIQKKSREPELDVLIEWIYYCHHRRSQCELHTVICKSNLWKLHLLLAPDSCPGVFSRRVFCTLFWCLHRWRFSQLRGQPFALFRGWACSHFSSFQIILNNERLIWLSNAPKKTAETEVVGINR